MTEETSAPKTWFGHPAGLSTLFFTELWERFSYYGMRALLVLFMVDAVKTGGMGLDDKTASSIYGLYTAFVYLAALPGGWIADRLLGAQRSVWVGGLIIAAGHFTLAIPSTAAFFVGLVLVVIGTGFLKPNISAIVGQLYPEGGARRDAGFTIFYMGINMGAFLGPLICSYLGEQVNWHAGFGVAGVGMLAGVIQYKFSVGRLGDAGLHSSAPKREGGGIDKAWYPVIGGFSVVALLVVLGLSGVIKFNALALAQNTTFVIVGLAVAFFVYIFAFGKLNPTERKHTIVIVVLFVASAVFWSGFEQAGSSLNLFADRHTDRFVFGFEIPAGWFQSLNPFYIVVFAPIFATFWVGLARKRMDPSMPAKFAIGMVILGLGFLVMVGAANLVTDGGQAGPYWLILTYLLHTMGELCLSPVGLSSVTKLAPKRFVGQMMGIWFLATSLGNLMAGLMAGRFNPESLNEMPGLFMQIVLTSVGGGLLLLLFTKPIKKLIGNLE
ncbi:MAG: peptide MFS transporter [Opitutales bacterium]|jgi:proton-dependent oligopeptide transporter, POT family|nr:peptide MFS transporter [Opitutales bacterium]MBT5170533.1 peptide MFS transporter [Opitutales bacterium]MBT5812762.1 peptide MFS transporter [Opitutales bacterium]MBT6380928.1 peptide MFS transporter [Opitutales bacterium]MBT6769573.1 peptide MFS transporter [Opitutales bacterium]